MTPRSKTALYPGSFRPFTVGHKSIADRTLAICDRLVIAVGYNPDKESGDTTRIVAGIKRIFADDPRVEVASYAGLTTEFARLCGADFMVRGVRSVTDYEYERNLAEVNLRISGIETLLMPALPELAFVSSSMVRELASHGYDTSEFLPPEKTGPDNV
ncbi:MAG: pantetheine-phosphate adenylyltransferase [Muribaculaceae bacterium]|nr:pantetheine-phosphate adenylyltransferase [Muribaculaceae bacterium]